MNLALYKWAGVANVLPDSRGVFLDDARKLELLEGMDHHEFLQFKNASNDNFVGTWSYSLVS